MNLISTKDIKWVEKSKEDIKNIAEKIENLEIDKDDDNGNSGGENTEKKESTISKLKNFVKKAVNCCIE